MICCGFFRAENLSVEISQIRQDFEKSSVKCIGNFDGFASLIISYCDVLHVATTAQNEAWDLYFM